MKIEELIKKTGDKLISQKDKLAYNMAVKKLELIAKIPDKKQRSEAMGKFKDILAKKVTPVVMAALTAISPVVLSGCDETTKNPSDTQIAYVTDNNGEYVTDENGNPETIITSPGVETPENPYSEMVVEGLQEFFSEWDWNKVINGDYSAQINNTLLDMGTLIDDDNKSLLDSKYCYLFDESVHTTTIGCNRYRKSMDTLINKEAKYCVNIDIPSNTTGTEIRYLRDAQTDTTGFIVTLPTGEVEYNGVFNGVIYKDGQGYLKDVPFAINEENNQIIEQMESKEGLAKLISDSIVLKMFMSDKSEQMSESVLKQGLESGSNLINVSRYQESVMKSYTVIEVFQINVKDTSEFSYNYGTRAKTTFNIYNLNDEGIKNWNAVNTEISVPDENGNQYIIANLTYDYNPENIILPTQESSTEAEVER